MGSKRFPGKSMAPIGGKPLIAHVLIRALEIHQVHRVVLATSFLEEDDVLADYASNEYGVEVYRGDPNDVRSRFFEIIKIFNPRNLVRLTADDPFKDPRLAEEALNILVTNSLDYVSNFSPQCLPVGMDVEAFTAGAFLDSISRFHSQEDLEHVTVSLRNSGMYRTKSLLYESELSNFRLTIDHPEDLAICQEIYKMLEEAESDKVFEYKVTCRIIEKAIEMGRI